MKILRRTFPMLAALGLAGAAGGALAGPPFLTDDPETLEYGHSEAYVFSTHDKAPDGKEIAVPAFEYNVTPAPNSQIHLVVPFLGERPTGGVRAYGLGDVELGFKYRFVEESESHPEIGIFPMLELPTGDADRGLGNGRVWGFFPVWLQRSVGPWIVDFGGGRAFDAAPGMTNYNFGGALLQRKVTDRLILGGEIFAKGATSEDGEHTTLATFGGYYTPPGGCRGCQVLFDLGHSVAGETHAVGYLGLYWEFGPKGG